MPKSKFSTFKIQMNICPNFLFCYNNHSKNINLFNCLANGIHLNTGKICNLTFKMITYAVGHKHFTFFNFICLNASDQPCLKVKHRHYITFTVKSNEYTSTIEIIEDVGLLSLNIDYVSLRSVKI